ncbi:MAG: hypothetical protein R3C02_04835 [Planctomycetaceae bacterium]
MNRLKIPGARDASISLIGCLEFSCGLFREFLQNIFRTSLIDRSRRLFDARSR